MRSLLQLQDLMPGAYERSTPPVLPLDAIWFTQLCATGQFRTDARETAEKHLLPASQRSAPA